MFRNIAELFSNRCKSLLLVPTGARVIFRVIAPNAPLANSARAIRTIGGIYISSKFDAVAKTGTKLYH